MNKYESEFLISMLIFAILQVQSSFVIVNEKTKLKLCRSTQRVNHFRMIHSQQNNMLSYIVLFTNEYCHVIIFCVSILAYFNLKFCLKIFGSNAQDFTHSMYNQKHPAGPHRVNRGI
jgi:hypothetical protein